jgi:hypothetical protein
MKVVRLASPPSILSLQPQGSTSPLMLDEKTRAIDRSGLKVGDCPHRESGKVMTSRIPKRDFFNSTSSKKGFQSLFH